MLLETVDTPGKVPSLAPDHAPIYRLEAEILKQPQVELPIEHQFCTGLYARTMLIPAGTVATGAVHKNESFFVVRSGELVAHTAEGPVRLPPGHMSVTRAGDKRAVVAVTDVVVTTFHPNPQNETEPQALWDMFTTPAQPLIATAGTPHLEQKL